MPAVRRLRLLDGAARAEGLAVIIDVLRAGSFSCYALGAGADRIVAVAEVTDAIALKQRNPGWLLAGERGGEPPPGFDIGNSPSALAGRDLSGTTVIHCTSAGTRGIAATAGIAGPVVTGCFVNAAALVTRLQSSGSGIVSLICMGTEGVFPADEDEAFADYVEACLCGQSPPPRHFLDRVRRSTSGSLFAAGDRPGRPSADLDLCTDIDRFGFVPQVTGRLEGHPLVERR